MKSKILNKILVQVRKTIGKHSFKRIEWDTGQPNEVFDLRKRTISFSFDLIAVVTIIGVMALLFY